MNSLKKSITAAIAVMLSLGQVPAHAWSVQGHQIIARLAFVQLTPAARKQIDMLLAMEPGATLESISTWADETRTHSTAAWHYVNFPRDSCTYSAERECPDGNCVVGAIDRQTEILKHDTSPEKRLQALKYVVHFVGDVHQPLHAGYTDDKGGNTYQLQVLTRGTNLHALWDSGLIRQLGQDVPTLGDRLLPQSITNASSTASAVQAAEESCKIVTMPGFYPQRTVPNDYFATFTPVMEARLATAGARLARVLNQAFGQ